MKSLIDKYPEPIDHVHHYIYFKKYFNELIKFGNLFNFHVEYYFQKFKGNSKKKIIFVSKKWMF